MQFLKNVPEGFKTCFDTARSKISQNAAIPAKNDGFTKQKHIRGDKALKIQKFGPNVIYFALGITEGRPAGAFGKKQIVF